MNPPLGPKPRERRYGVRQQARLDGETHAKLEALATALHWKRTAILRFVMGWGLTHGKAWTVDPSIPDHPHLVHMLVEPDLLQQVQEAAERHSVPVAAWLRHAIRQVTPDDFPASWRAEAAVSRSHESGYYDRRFQLRLDQAIQNKLGTLMQTFHRTAAEVIRQLIAQAAPEDFSLSWHLAVDEQRQRRLKLGAGD
jgi:predicted transcriptional regulator